MNRKMEDMDKNVEMNAFIAELKENQRKIEDKNEYYDEAKDREDIQSYYSGIDFEQTSSKELFTKLNDLVTRTHHTKLPYSTETRNYLYSWADLQENGKLKSIYSGQQQNPEEVIKEDYKTFLRREKAYNTLVTNDKKDEKTLEVMKESIEKENKYNCEHVVPQSWFDKGNPMRGDLHHLFACEPKCNSSRSNHPFYDFSDYSPEASTKTIRETCGKYEENKFEPESGKGEAARATLYFLLRYPGEIRNYKGEDITMLVKWHRDDEVSLYEKHRNRAIWEKQGNRNPLIDFPQYVSKIDFALGLM
ncbi:endonuclease I family protein [Priestia endophytica]